MALELGRAVEIHGAVQTGELWALRAASTTAPRAAAGVSGRYDGRVKGLHRLNIKKWMHGNNEFMNRSRPLCTLQIGVDF